MTTCSTTSAAERFKQYLKKEGLFFTPQRLAIAEFIINKKNHHFSAEGLVSELREHGNLVSRATVYRTLSHLQQAGFLREVALNSSQVCYDFIANARHHEHLVCEACGSIIEFTDPLLEQSIEAIALRSGMQMTQHTVQIFGICAPCRTTPDTGIRTQTTSDKNTL